MNIRLAARGRTGCSRPRRRPARDPPTGARSSSSSVPWRCASERGDPFGRGREHTRWPARHARTPARCECVLPVPGGWATHYSCCGSVAGPGAAVAAPGALRDLELEVLGWRVDDGETMLTCRLVDGSVGRVPARWTDLPLRGAPERTLGVFASPGGWRQLAEVAEGVRERRPGRGGACAENGGLDVRAARVVGQREGDRAGGGVGDVSGGGSAAGDGRAGAAARAAGRGGA